MMSDSEDKTNMLGDIPLSNGDDVVAGFTVIADKTQQSFLKCQEILPSWITNATIFSSELTDCCRVEEFLGLNSSLCSRLIAMGCTELFPVQKCTIPFILRSYGTKKEGTPVRPSDLCISAPTGSGKTLAYAVPLVQLLLNRKHTFVRVLIVLPVRDLATQVYSVFKELTANTDLRVALLCGLKSFAKEQTDLIDSSSVPFRSKVDIVIATPGRLVDHLYNTVGFSMERLRILVIDEADRVIAEEKQDWYRVLEDAIYHPAAFQFDPNLVSTRSRLQRCVRKRPLMNFMDQYDTTHDISLQKILVSATLTHDPGPLKRFNLYYPRLFCSSTKSVSSDVGVSDVSTCPQPNTSDKEKESEGGDLHLSSEPAHVLTNSTGGVGVFSTPSGLKENVVLVPPDVRAMFLVHLVRHRGIQRILCFTNARVTTVRLATLLQNFKDVQVSQLSAQMPPEKRQRILHAFSRGQLNILVCTDSMARGMDIKDVECVVSYEMPPNVVTYVHRVGRTARAGQPGVAYTLLVRNQFFHFKNDLKKVGKTKLKEVGFHASQMHDLRSEYKAALKQLELSVKESTKTTPKELHQQKKNENHDSNDQSVEVAHSPPKKKRKKHESKKMDNLTTD